MKYAADTSVPVSKSRSEIEETVTRYGASRFASMTEKDRAVVVFEAQQRRIMFQLPLPSRDDFKMRQNGYHRAGRFFEGEPTERSPEEIEKQWERACRQRWRALALVIKAKLEAVESGISEFEDEFLANIVLANGQTVGKWLRPQLAAAYKHDKMPPLLPAGTL